MSHIQLGRYNQLEVVKEVDFGMYLNGDEDGEILLPKRYVPQGCKPGDVLNVFIYLDMDERLVATTRALCSSRRICLSGSSMGKPVWCISGLGTDEGPFCSVP